MADQLHNDDARFLELLDKWQSGDFTRHDERELLDLAGKDPFRQEALDGLQQFPEADHRAALKKLHRRLLHDRKPGLAFSMRLLSVAAVLALLLGAVWFFSRPPVDISGNSPIAHTEVQTPDQPEATPAPAGKSTPPDTGPAIAKNDRIQPALPPPAASGPASSEHAPEEPASQPVVASNLPERQPESSDEAARRKQDDVADMEKQEPDHDIQPAAPQSDAAGYAVAETKEKAARKAESIPNQRFLSEQTDSVLPELKAIKPAPGAVPDQGWDAFGQYLRNTARLTAEARANNVSGYVRVQFFVKTSGRPEKFRIMKSLGYGCDEIAIQLIKDWKWHRQSAAPVLVDVPFVR